MINRSEFNNFRPKNGREKDKGKYKPDKAGK